MTHTLTAAPVQVPPELENQIRSTIISLFLVLSKSSANPLLIPHTYPQSLAVAILTLVLQ